MTGEVKPGMITKKWIAFRCFFLFLLTISILIISGQKNSFAAGIVGSKHDLVAIDYPYGVCTECHTPHYANDIRLWPRVSNAATNPAAITTPDTAAVSKMCLDCHAYDVVTDLPALPGPGGMWAWGITWPVPRQLFDNAGNWIYKKHGGKTYKDCVRCHTHATGFGLPPIDPPTSATCYDCHVWDDTTNNDDIDNYTFGTQATVNFLDRAMIDEVQWTTGGHRVPAVDTLPETSRRAAQSGPELGCVDTGGAIPNGCHDDAILHGTAGNPFRLKVVGGATGADIISNLCGQTICHPPPAAGGVHMLHADPAPGPANLYEKGVCSDCHDPHGDSSNVDASLVSVPDININAAMMQREVVWRDRWTAGAFGDPTDTNPVVVPADDKLEPITRFHITGGNDALSWEMADYVKDSTSFSGVCEACHTADGTSGAITRFFRRKDADGDTQLPFHDLTGTNACASCHEHVKGFQKPDICTCIDNPTTGTAGCHTGVDAQFATVVGGVSSGARQHDIAYDPVNNPKGNNLLEEDCENVDCLKCHDLDTNSNHTDGTVYLDAIDTKAGTVPLQSPSAYADAAPEGTGTIQSINDTVWGNIRDDGGYTTGQWCRNCHDIDGPPAAASTNLNGNAVAPPNVESDSSGAARFTTTGHGATSGTNFPRVAPNNTAGRTACTGCHNYHGSDNIRMIQRAAWNGSAWQKWNGVNVPEPLDTSAADYLYNGDDVNISSVELFCLESCHVVDSFSWTTPQPLSLDFSDVITARGGATTKRAHYVFDYVGGNLGADYDAHNDITYYFSGKAVGFVLGGTAGTPWNDLDTSDSNPATQNHTYINDSSKGEAQKFVNIITSTPSPGTINSIFKAIWYNDGVDKGRAICVTCHDPHGSNVDATWGLPNKVPASTDDNMLRGEWITGTAWGADADEPCDSCHK